MEILLSCLLLIAGFAALIKGADWFVEGSSGLAANFRVPSVIIGLTIVAMGTSAPELAVSTSAALAGSNEIALSNVVGSNIFNLLGVLGICALIHPIPIDNTIMKRDFPVTVGISLLTLLAAGLGFVLSGNFAGKGMLDNVGEVSRIYGIILLVMFAAYIVMLIMQAKKEKSPENGSGASAPIGECIMLIIVGLVCIVAGGHFVVDSAEKIAAAAGMSETLIGLTIVAVGTSLPELVTSIVASKKGENGLAVGNVVGSNIFNILLILGVSSTINPIAVNLASLLDLAILIVVSVITFIFAKSGKLGRPAGAVMVGLYIADVIFAILR